MAHLSNAQLQTLKAAILADPTMAAFPNTTDGNLDLATYLNQLAVPDYFVFKTSVTITQIGDNIVASELAGLSSLNATRLQTIVQLSPAGVNPSLADRRAFFNDVFSGTGGQLTRAKLLLSWGRKATRFEKIFAVATPGGSGTRGTTANPDTLGVGTTAGDFIASPITAAHVAEARNLA